MLAQAQGWAVGQTLLRRVGTADAGVLSFLANSDAVQPLWPIELAPTRQMFRVVQ